MPATATKTRPPKAAAKTTPAKRPTYPDEVVDQARKTRDLLRSVGVNYAPGRDAHAILRRLVGDEDPAKYAGVPFSALRKYVLTGDTPEKKGNLAQIAGAINNEVRANWARGRNLAAMLVVMAEARKTS